MTAVDAAPRSTDRRRMINALRALGFDYVFDTNMAAGVAAAAAAAAPLAAHQIQISSHQKLAANAAEPMARAWRQAGASAQAAHVARRAAPD